MKKSLLVISVILLIAGLFISCNSEAAGTNSEVGYVKFGDSKALTASVTPESGPAISDLYWYYKATKTSGGIAIGQTSEWTRVNNSTGLSGTIGPFSKGSWAFELVGTTSTDAPSNTSYDPEGTGASRWTIEDDSVKYYGVSGTAGEETRTSITLTTGTTVIPVSLKWRQTSTTATVKFNNVSVLDSSETMELPANTTVYLTVKFGDYVLADSISAYNTTVGSNVYYSDSTGLTIPAAELGAKNLYVEVYEDSERTSKVQEGSVGFTAAAGDTITITGNIGSLEAYYGEFLNSSKTAYVFNGSSFTYYDTLEAAIEAAADGDTIGLLKDVTSPQINIVDKSITLNGNGYTLTSSASNSTSHTGTGASLSDYSCFAIALYTSAEKSQQLIDNNSAPIQLTVENLKIESQTARYGLYFDGYVVGTVDSCKISIPGSSVNSGSYINTDDKVYPATVTVKGSEIGHSSGNNVSVWMGTPLSVSGGGILIVDGGTYQGDKTLSTFTSGGKIIVNSGTFTGTVMNYAVTSPYTNYKYAEDDTSVNSVIEINGGVFSQCSFTCQSGTSTTITGGTFSADPTAYVDTTNYNVTESDSTWTVTAKN